MHTVALDRVFVEGHTTFMRRHPVNVHPPVTAARTTHGLGIWRAFEKTRARRFMLRDYMGPTSMIVVS